MNKALLKGSPAQRRSPTLAHHGGTLPGTLLAAYVLLSTCTLGAAIPNSECLSCHESKTLEKKRGDGKSVSLYIDATQCAESIHASTDCTSCHTGITKVPHPDNFSAKPAHCQTCHEKAVSSYGASNHGLAHMAGSTKAPSCADCHGKHNTQRAGAPNSPLHHDRLAGTCGRCHEQIFQDLSTSVHGKAMAMGLRDAPTCTDCHADHQVKGLQSASPLKVAEDVCSRCHASERFNARYNLPADRVTTFFSSYHGMAAKIGAKGVANCASCHGYHNVLPSSDPRSPVNKANMVKTCQKCHPGANENFSLGKIHVDAANPQADDFGGRISWWVRQVYLLMIVGVIGGMLIHNALTIRKKFIAARKARGRTVLRMTLSQRIQHFLLLSSFITLAVTGFALKYPDSWIHFLVGSSESVRRIGHRLAAVVMLVLAVYHTIYVIRTREGRKLIVDFCPRWKDVLDVFANLRHLLFQRAPKPEFARFGYAEKAEYWAVVWGTIIMGLTGLIIWFKMEVTEWVPRWVVDVAITVHFYEALLAVLAIIVWHFYHVIFDSDIYPMNTAWFDGRMSEHVYREEHPLDKDTLATAEGENVVEEHGKTNSDNTHPKA